MRNGTLSGSIRFNPNERGRRLTMRLDLAWRADSGSVKQLRTQAHGRFRGSFDPETRIEAEVDYDFDTPRSLLTPCTGVALSENEEIWRAGAC